MGRLRRLQVVEALVDLVGLELLDRAREVGDKGLVEGHGRFEMIIR
jgi:hypothetical protein